MLVLEPKRNQKIILHDTVSGAVITVKTYLRDGGNLALAFDAPQTVRIKMERNPENDKRFTNKNEIL
jgi:sRNA-binding carbon storage regulator CsrA